MTKYRDAASRQLVLCSLVVSVLGVAPGLAQLRDWSNLGGNARMNGLVDVVGPDGPDLLWETNLFSYIGWHPVIEGTRVFVVRQTGFCPNPPPGDSAIYALDLDTGAILWTADLPYESGDWTTWIAGVKNGRVYASRSGNGGTVDAPLYCLDAATGAVLWDTTGNSSAPRYEIKAGPTTGAVFAPDGDIVVASNRWLERFDSVTGALVWRTARLEQLGNSTGAVIDGNAVYLPDLIVGSGNKIGVRKFDLDTGAFLYRGPLLVGGILHNGLYIGVDGRIYLQFSRNSNITADYLYSFTDTGTAIVQNWRVSSGGGGAYSRWGVGPDDSIYSMEWNGTPDHAIVALLQRLDPATGAVLGTQATAMTGDFLKFQVAVDSRGVLYVSNGTAGGQNNGRLYSLNPDLTERWSLPLYGNPNQGGPALGTDGTLIMASDGGFVRAYRTPSGPAVCAGDADCDGDVDFFDIDPFVAKLGCPNSDPTACAAGCAWQNADIDTDGDVDFFDIDPFVSRLGTVCP